MTRRGKSREPHDMVHGALNGRTVSQPSANDGHVGTGSDAGEGPDPTVESGVDPIEGKPAGVRQAQPRQWVRMDNDTTVRTFVLDTNVLLHNPDALFVL